MKISFVDFVFHEIKKPFNFQRILSLTLVFCSLLLLQGCNRSQTQKITFQTEYQAVFLDNGQIFFGKLENAGSDYPVLRDVFYVQTQTKPDTKEVKSILIKRGSEWHGPDYDVHQREAHCGHGASVSQFTSGTTYQGRKGTKRWEFAIAEMLNNHSFHDSQKGVSP